MFAALLETMQQTRADLTGTFRALSQPSVLTGEDTSALPPAFAPWLERWRQRLQQDDSRPPEVRAQAMRAVNPCYIPRNHLVEAMIRSAVEQGDFTPFETMLAVLSNPYEEQPGHERFALPPGADERVRYTFCGT